MKAMFSRVKRALKTMFCETKRLRLLTYTKLIGVDRRNVEGMLRLEGADLRKADLRLTDLTNANLANANLAKANLANAILADADLTYANLANANLANAILENANLRNADLTYANLADASLADANLAGANLRNADLADANLTNADLGNSNLTNANLRRAGLGNSNLTNADLTNADLTYARLDGVDLSGADLTGTVYAPFVGQDTAAMLQRVASHVLNSPDLLIMDRWHKYSFVADWCNTPHCIAGWAEVFFAKDHPDSTENLGSMAICHHAVGRLLLGYEASTHFYDSKDEALAYLKTVVAKDNEGEEIR